MRKPILFYKEVRIQIWQKLIISLTSLKTPCVKTLENILNSLLNFYWKKNFKAMPYSEVVLILRSVGHFRSKFDIYDFIKNWLTQLKCLYQFQLSVICPANIRLDEDVLKTCWRRLSSSSSEDVFKTSSKRFDQDEYIHLTHTSSEDVFKTSWSRPT